jgi:hypothetical protein
VALQSLHYLQKFYGFNTIGVKFVLSTTQIFRRNIDYVFYFGKNIADLDCPTLCNILMEVKKLCETEILHQQLLNCTIARNACKLPLADLWKYCQTGPSPQTRKWHHGGSSRLITFRIIETKNEKCVRLCQRCLQEPIFRVTKGQ